MRSRTLTQVCGGLLFAAALSNCADAGPVTTSAIEPCRDNETRFACLQPTERGPIAETVAVNTHYGNRLDLDALALLRVAGVRTLRNDLTWERIEREPGVYDFEASGYDALVEAAEEEGLRLLFILDYGNRLYGTRRAVVSDEGRVAFANFAAAAAARYGGRDHSWEVWNEPNHVLFWGGGNLRPDPDAYARLVEAVVPALRQADPGGKILVGSVYYGQPEIIERIGGIGGFEYLRRLAATGVLSVVDGVTAHFYRAEAPETVAADVAEIRGLLEETGVDIAVWSGEWGYSTYDPEAAATGINFIPATSLERQASYVVRMLLTNYTLDLGASVYFKDRDAGDPSPGDIEDHWGWYRDDLSPKPSYDAVRTLTSLVGNAQSPGTLALGEGEHGVVFDTDRARVVALWAVHEASWVVRPRSAEAKILALDGADITPPKFASGNAFEITLSLDQGPIYLVGEVEIESRSDRQVSH